MLQADLDNLQSWSDTWLLKFHPNKCKVMSVANKRVNKETKHYHLYNNDGNRIELEQSDGEKDIGVFVDENLSFNKHIQNQVNKANSICKLSKSA
jgi:penicillin V acylase-like amidase (Ntn superfamily)